MNKNNLPYFGGTPNRSGTPVNTRQTKDVRRAYMELLQLNIPRLQEWLEAVATKSPEKALLIFIEISKRFVPSLSQVNVEGEIKHTIQPPTIIKQLDTGDNPQTESFTVVS